MDAKAEMKYLKLKDITPYEKNPRKNKDAVKAVAESIKEFGAQNPIIVDNNRIIIAGHTRYMAALELGLTEFPCIVAVNLTPEQVKAYRLVDNKTSELSEWDMDLLTEEIAGILDIDLSRFGFDALGEGDDENPYSTKVNIPQYEVTGELPNTSELVDTIKGNILKQEIEEADITDEEKEFLKKAATRHYVFNYRKIAEYYANIANPVMQRLMERSALVIIDLDNAIANGYVKLAGDIADMLNEPEDEEE